MNQVIQEDQRMSRVIKLARNLAPNDLYHNFAHELDVYDIALKYAAIYQLDPESTLILELASLLHDSNKNEDKTSELAYKTLINVGYSSFQAYRVSKLIKATKIDYVPNDLLEAIIKDSDLDNLGREDFLEKNNLLRKELAKENIPDHEWYGQTLEFLKRHKYYTKAAQKFRNKGLKKNIALIERYLNLAIELS